MRECKRVQEDRPSCSTSGGQSLGDWRAVEVDIDLVTEEKSEKEVQARQLDTIGISFRTEASWEFTVFHLFLAQLWVSSHLVRKWALLQLCLSGQLLEYLLPSFVHTVLCTAGNLNTTPGSPPNA